MTRFEETLTKFVEEYETFHQEMTLMNEKARMFDEKFKAWLKELGCPDNFHLSQVMALALRKKSDD